MAKLSGGQWVTRTPKTVAEVKDRYPVVLIDTVCGGPAVYYLNLPSRGRPLDATRARYGNNTQPAECGAHVVCESCGGRRSVDELAWRGKSW